MEGFGWVLLLVLSRVGRVRGRIHDDDVVVGIEEV